MFVSLNALKVYANIAHLVVSVSPRYIVVPAPLAARLMYSEGSSEEYPRTKADPASLARPLIAFTSRADLYSDPASCGSNARHGSW